MISLVCALVAYVVASEAGGTTKCCFFRISRLTAHLLVYLRRDVPDAPHPLFYSARNCSQHFCYSSMMLQGWNMFLQLPAILQDAKPACASTLVTRDNLAVLLPRQELRQPNPLVSSPVAEKGTGTLLICHSILYTSFYDLQLAVLLPISLATLVQWPPY